MNKFSKQYIYPIQDEADKIKIRKWVGSYRGMSILRSDWITRGDEWYANEAYTLNIKNRKTELLFKLTFPNATEITKWYLLCRIPSAK